MTRAEAVLLTAGRFIAAGTYPQQCPADLKADEALLSELTDALRDQQGGPPCT